MASFLAPADPASLTLAELKDRCRYLMDRAGSGSPDEPVPAGWFRCLICRREFEKGQTDQEAAREYQHRFGEAMPPHGEVHVLCSDCDRIVARDMGLAPAKEAGCG